MIYVQLKHTLKAIIVSKFGCYCKQATWMLTCIMPSYYEYSVNLLTIIAFEVCFNNMNYFSA